ncbi:DUF134 domain-containing protein [Candidatus Woesearchaeota archaeon]|nr:DUF134 domain-containing protein [Candidatus Woesearchaeota archaeon]
MRPRRFRRVMFGPNVDYFKPRGIALIDLDTVNLNIEELEAIRLKDFENMEQTEAAKKMNVSQPTFHRILQEARKKIADALVSGKAIQIQGGIYKMPGGDMTGPLGQGPMTGRGQGMAQGAGRGQGRGMGRGAGMGQGYGGPKECKCPKCGEKVPHVRGQPCVKQKCPKCGTMMIRGDID